MSNTPRSLGTGHPNKYLQRDYAEASSQWFVRLETLVPVENGKLEDVRKWLESNGANDPDLANYLISQVPKSKEIQDQENARHMVAAAFGMEYPPLGDRKRQNTVRPSAK